MLFVQPDITPGTAAAEEVDTDGEDTAIVGGEVQSKPSAQAYRSRASSLSGSFQNRTSPEADRGGDTEGFASGL